MSTVSEIQKAITELPPQGEAALIASLDQAARQLDEGKGAPIEDVRRQVGKWAEK